MVRVRAGRFCDFRCAFFLALCTTGTAACAPAELNILREFCLRGICEFLDATLFQCTARWAQQAVPLQIQLIPYRPRIRQPLFPTDHSWMQTPSADVRFAIQINYARTSASSLRSSGNIASMPGTWQRPGIVSRCLSGVASAASSCSPIQYGTTGSSVQ